jgi:thiol-disulfide isomerase/thioredoxin
MLLKLLIGAGIGALIGGFLGSTRSCETGGCPLTANPTRGALVGGLLGLLLATTLTTTTGQAVTETGPSAAATVTSLAELQTALSSASWCPACRAYAPKVESAARALGPAVPFFKVDTDKAGEAAAHFGVKYLPTSLIFEHGKEASRFVGSKDSAELVQLLGGTNER